MTDPTGFSAVGFFSFNGINGAEGAEDKEKLKEKIRDACLKGCMEEGGNKIYIYKPDGTGQEDAKSPPSATKAAKEGESRTWGSYFPGVEYGDQAATHYANRVVHTTFTEDPLARVGLGLSVLWTKDTAAETTFNLAGGELISGVKVAGGYLWRVGLNGAEKSVFWAGKPGTQAIAEIFALEHGLKTIGMTPIGIALSNLGKLVPLKVWEKASETFAKNAQGVATAVLGSPYPGTIWIRIESKILESRGIPVNVVTGGH